LTFRSAVDWFAGSGTFTLSAETSLDGVTWSPVWSISPSADVPSDLINLNLAALDGTSFFIRFRFNGNAFNIDNWYIDDVTLSGIPALTYTWSTSPSLTPSIAATQSTSVTPSSTQTYYVAASLNGCNSVTDNVVVTVNPTPDPIISAASATICANAVIPLTVSVTASTVTWSSNVSSTLFTNPIGTTPYIPLTNTTGVFVKTPSTATITVTATNNPSGCQKTASVVFTVNTRNWNGFTWSNPTSTANPNDLTANLVFLASANSTGNISGCSCTVNSGATVTFNAGHTLSLANGLTVLGTGSMIFNSGASLLQTNNVANSGNITYRRTTNMRKFDYTYWSSPVAGETLLDLSPNTLSDKYFSWNATGNNWVNIPSSTIMAPGIGYIARGPQGYSVTNLTSYTGSFIGVPNNGDYSIAIAKTVANDLNLIGNPYPSALDADLFLLGNTGAFGTGTTLYFWTHNTLFTNNLYNDSDYAMYNFTGGTRTALAASSPGANTTAPTGKIAAGQGFMIQAVNAGTATFTNSMRVAGNNTNFYRPQGAYDNERDALLLSQKAAIEGLERHRIWLDLTNDQGLFKELLLAYVENATNNYEEAFDGDAGDNGGTVGFYSLQSTHKLGIQGRALPFDVTDIVPLGLQLPVAGSYNIQLSSFDGLFADDTTPVYLEDKLLQVLHNLRQGAYNFVSEAGTFDDRFVIRFTNDLLQVSDSDFNENAVVVFKNNNAVTVQSSSLLMKEVQLYDVRGRLIMAKNNIRTDKVVFENLAIAQQVLLVQITTENGSVVVKKIIF
jgi:hypothetical protein